MKILIISPGVLPIPAVDGGAVENLIDIFIEQNELSNNEITVYSIESEKAALNSKKNKKCEYRYVKINGILNYLMKLMRWIINKIPGIYIGNLYMNKIIKDLKQKKEEKKYDAVIIENMPLYVLPMIENFDMDVFLHMHNEFLNSKTKKAQKIINGCKKILCVSDYISNQIREVDNTKNNITTVYNGIDLKLFKEKIPIKKTIELKQLYNIKEDDYVYMYTGRITEEKGILELVQAFIKLKEKKDNVKLLIVGSSFFNNSKKTKYMSEVKKIAAKEKENILFTGFIEHNQLPKIYSIVDVQIVPSQWDDPCPLSVIEGLASAKPLVVSISGGIPELVDNESAILIERNSQFVENLTKAMIKIGENKEMNIQMGNAANKRAENFTKERYFKNLLKECK